MIPVIPASEVPERKRVLSDREAFFAKANEHKAKGIALRKEKRYWDALEEDALHFHEMRLCEVFIRDSAIQDAKDARNHGVFSPDQYKKAVKSADDFLASWSDKARAAHTMRTSISRLKLDEEEKDSISSDIVKWSLKGGKEKDLQAIIQFYQNRYAANNKEVIP